MPLDYGYLGLDVETLNPHSLANLRKALLEKGILSATTSSGIPCQAKTDFMLVATELAVLSFKIQSSGNLK